MNSLENYRGKIDSIDDEILNLLEKRLDIVLKIGEIKNKTNINIYDPKREEDILLKVSNNLQNKDMEKPIIEIFKKIMDISKDIQSV